MASSEVRVTRIYITLLREACRHGAGNISDSNYFILRDRTSELARVTLFCLCANFDTSKYMAKYDDAEQPVFAILLISL